MKDSKASLSDRIAFHAFWICGLVLVFFSGALAANSTWFSSALDMAESGYKKVADTAQEQHPFAYLPARNPQAPRIHNASGVSDELTLLSRLGPNRDIFIDVLDRDGNVVHQWNIDWFKIWPDAKHIAEVNVPKDRPGTIVHGVILLENGNIVFNFEHLGLVCLDLEGRVVWRLPYLTHHSAVRADDGHIWVCGNIYHERPDARAPNWKPPFWEDTFIEVSPEGKILHEWSVIDLLRKNGLTGLLHMRAKNDLTTADTGDIFHLNDVEPFPDHLKEGFFKKGDIMISLRNINTVLVFNRSDEKIKLMSVGQFVRQHDPDFVDGNTFSVFNNNNVNENAGQSVSRIDIVTAPDLTLKTYYAGDEEHPFYTRVGGKHTWLSNGNLLIVETCNGRAFEIDRNKGIIWEYNNFTGDGYVGWVGDAVRIPSSYASLFKKPKSPSVSK